MKVEYINHSGILIEIDEVILVFDYIKGKLPSINTTKKIIFFISHHHFDHFSKDIFNYKYPNVDYVVSKDVSINHQAHIMDSYETLEIDKVKITTIQSTDIGVGFIVQYKNKTIFHAGDFNYWNWKIETPQDEIEWKEQTEMFEKELPKLNRHFDLVCFPIDPRLEENALDGLTKLIENSDIDIIMPIHFWDNFKYVKNLKETYKYAEKVLLVKHNNQFFEI